MITRKQRSKINFSRYILKKRILYKCKDFLINYNENDAFSIEGYKFDNHIIASGSAILCMGSLIHNNSKFLSDPKLRKVPIRKKDTIDMLETLDLSGNKLEMIRKYRTSDLHNFWCDGYNNLLPLDFYIELTKKFCPIISQVVEHSKTLGDIIDGFSVIHKQIHRELQPLEFYQNIIKYNL